MSKQKILHLPGHRHFVTFTTYKRRRFLNPDLTKDIIVEVLQKNLLTHEVFCTGFAVMSDHVHAILFGNEEFNISQFVQIWKKTTSYRIKKFYEREMPHFLESFSDNDPIWQSGFYDLNLETDERINEKLDYIHGNPVIEKLAPDLISWKWSSARFYELGEPVGVTITP